MLGGADFKMDMDGAEARGRVLWTDYSYALVYECFGYHEEDGSCDPGKANIVVYGRVRELPGTIPEEVKAMNEAVCVTKEDFESIPQAGQ